jgi:hypothetical protein
MALTMPGSNPMEDMMGQAVEAAFLKVFQDAIQPLLQRLTEVEVTVNMMASQQAELVALIDKVKNGNGMLSKLLLAKG